MEDKEQLKKLIAEGKIKETLEELAAQTANTALYDDVVLLQGQLATLEQKITNNTIMPIRLFMVIITMNPVAMKSATTG